MKKSRERHGFRATLALICASATAATATPLVAVDVGHTLQAPGAISARGRSELAFNHDLARKVVDALHALDVRTVLVNADGRIESLQARPASVPQADFFLSIHHDSTNASELTEWDWMGTPQTFSDRWAGHSMFVSTRNPDLATSLLCGRTIGARLQRAGLMPTDKNARRRAYLDAEHAVHAFDNLVVLYRAQQPALLFEAGVIKHRDEELLLRDEARQQRMAQEIATGLKACLTAGR
ncbi:MAG: N-acetylmuramoyl-L-alanine amidase [Pseudazoarcus pumilus]|nr:N-acetylmuramoyl-L-alanine amidase [Pseudazoarcus pumilus]